MHAHDLSWNSNGQWNLRSSDSRGVSIGTTGTRVVALIAVVVVVAALVPIYFVITRSAHTYCMSAPATSNFPSFPVKSNGSIAMVLSDPTSASLQPILANNSSVAIAVIAWTFNPTGPNGTLEGYVHQLQAVGIFVLGYISEMPSRCPRWRIMPRAG